MGEPESRPFTVREILGDARFEAARLVASWGFPRPIELGEIRTGVWLRNVPQTGIVWLVEGPITPRHWCLHAMPDPSCSGVQLLRPEVFMAIRTVAGLLGAQRVYAPLGSTRPGWARYLGRRCGFDQVDALGPFYELGD